MIASKETPTANDLYDQYSPALYGVCLSLTKDEQLAQKALINLFYGLRFNNNHFTQTKVRLFTWLYQQSREECLKLMTGHQGHSNKPITLPANAPGKLIPRREHLLL